MISNKKTAKIIGLIFLIQFFTGILIKQFLLGPDTFETEFIKTAATESNQIVGAVLIGLVSSGFPVIIAVLLVPLVRPALPRTSLFYFGFSIIGFMFAAIEFFSILSLLSLSQEFIKAGASASKQFQTLGAVFSGIRWWTHFMALLASTVPLALFYYLLFRVKLVPSFISIWGFIAVLLMLTTLLLAIFGQGTYMLLFLPLGLNHLFLGVWLLIKEFNTSELISVPN